MRSSSRPRLAFCGNIGNTHFQIAKALRAVGWDAHLFVGANDPLTYRPESDEPEWGSGYPDWIHEGDWFMPIHGALPWTSPLIDALQPFDVVVASGNLPIVVHLARKPWIFLTTGADLTKNPFALAFWRQRPSWASRLGYMVVSAWQRRAIRRADQIWTQPFAPFMDALKRLNVDPARIADAWLALSIDTDTFAPAEPNQRPSGIQDEIAAAGDFIVFHPTRLVFDTADHMQRSGQWKGSRTLFDGFAQFAKSHVASRPVLVLPRRGHREAERQAEAIISELGIEENVLWLQPPRSDGFTRSELISVYQAADIAVDEFGSGWFGFVSVEAMSCGVPVVSRIDRLAIQKMYGDDWCWLDAHDADQFSSRLDELAADRITLAALGRQSREWILRHHGPEATQAHYVRSFGTRVADLTSAGG